MDNEPADLRGIVLRLRDGKLKRINELQHSYVSLQYPIIFTYGTVGYHLYLESRLPSGQGARKVTQTKYYSYNLMVRDGGNHILHMQRLQQFLVNVYCKTETECLCYIF